MARRRRLCGRCERLRTVTGVDVIIAARGGGSAEDLHAFNDEGVARAIAASPIPVISAIGHEVDFTIADFVADLRAPTPSAAAELVVAAKDEFCARIDSLKQRLDGAIRSQLQRRRQLLHVLSSRRGLAGWPAAVALRQRHTSEIVHRLRRAATALVAQRQQRFRALRLALEARDVRRRLAAIRGRLPPRMGGSRRRRCETAIGRMRDSGSSSAGCDNLSPLAVLARGYAVCWNADRTAIIHTASQVAPGDRVRVTLHEGELHCDVTPSRIIMDPTIKDFESATAELDAIVRKLEEGDLPLEQSMQLYERGLQLSRFCHAKIEEAERRIELLNERGELRAAPAALGLSGDDESTRPR